MILSSNVFNLDPHIGVELHYKNLIFVRSGVGQFALIPDFDKQSLNFQPSIGIGLNLYHLKLDYALTDIGDNSIALYSNIFSLSYSFNHIKFKKRLINE